MEEKREDQMKEITKKLERGVKELFTSDMYTEYLVLYPVSNNSLRL